MADAASQPVKKKRKAVVVGLSDRSDESIVLVGEDHPLSQPVQSTSNGSNPNENPEAFYSQREHPKFYTRNLDRALERESEFLQSVRTLRETL